MSASASSPSSVTLTAAERLAAAKAVLDAAKARRAEERATKEAEKARRAEERAAKAAEKATKPKRPVGRPRKIPLPVASTETTAATATDELAALKSSNTTLHASVTALQAEVAALREQLTSFLASQSKD